MKKFFYSTLAVLAFVGCGKIETPSVDIRSNQPAEISFASQATFGTKAVVTGTVLPDGATFSVFADVNEDGSLNDRNYLTNAEYNESGNPADASKHYYWPVSDKPITLDFYAVYPYSASTSRSAAGVATVAVVCEAVNDASVDVMLATTKGQSYDDSKTDEQNRKPLNFEHQLSYVSFQAKKEDIAALLNVKIKEIKVTVPNTKGEIAFTDNSNAPLTPTAGTYVYSTVTSTVADTELSASAWTDCGYFIAIPQDITVAGAKASIKYEYQVGNKTYTKTVDNLSLKSKDTTAWTAWAKGTHYTYNITIGLKEILFTVTASGWSSDGGAKEIY